MSLLVINSSSRVARGLIKGFANAGTHEKILCADLFPNYKAIERHLSLTEEVAAPQRLTDLKITGKQSLVDAIEQADQVLYVTHDHYLNVASKTSMFENVVSIMGEKFPNKKVRAELPDRPCHSFRVRPHQRARTHLHEPA